MEKERLRRSLSNSSRDDVMTLGVTSLGPDSIYRIGGL
ncbi:Uncharacterised protein [Macrococcoides caseolyticum]|nr:Uncharacterised protein [Macrococcus caseolyticus]